MLHVQTQLVILDTAVTDAAGKPVAGLTRDDFQVYQDGVLQNVRNFESFNPQSSIPMQPTKDRNGHDDWGEAAKTILVMDELNTPFEEMAYSRNEVNRYLKAQHGLMSGPTMVMYVNDYGFHPLGCYTRDPQVLLNEVASHKPQLPDKLARDAGAELLEQSFSVLQQIAISTRGERGRKLLIWIGEGFPEINIKALLPDDDKRFKAAIRYTSNLLLESRVTVYKIEPTSALPPPDDLTNDDDPVSSVVIQDPSTDNFNFNSFVVQTGGRYFYNHNDLDTEIFTATGYGSTYYTLSYSPGSALAQGEYHVIRVVMRHPGLHAWTKQGFYPPSQVDPHPKMNELGSQLYEAAVSGMVYSGIGVHVDQCTSDEAVQVSCRVLVDTSSVTLEDPDGNARKASLYVVLAGLDAKGKVASASEKEFTSIITAGDPRSLATGHFAIVFHGNLALNARAARMIVRDSAGKIGTFDIPLAPQPHRFPLAK